ncbi:hypothetical protein ABZO31_07120 [Streptomyces sp. HUAS MG47]|uniref:hypothetical protein n=1 Tax=Streptomyces solicamelliae TaxID=3231716 RepID=UPI003878126E
MDEMKTLRDFRADAPAPDRARLTPGRQRLLDATARRDPGWGERLRLKIVAPVGAAALTALVVLGVQTWSGPPRDEVRPASGVTFLEEAARGIERTGDGKPAPRLGPDEWAYRISADLWRPEPEKKSEFPPLPKDCAVDLPGGLGPGVVQVQVDEFWRRGDGTKGGGATHRAGKCGKTDSFNMSAGPYPKYGRPIGYYYDFVAKPRTPEHLVDELRGSGISGDFSTKADDAGDFQTLVGLFHMPLETTPEFTATVYRAMARIPGVMVTQEQDAMFGRKVAVVAHKGDAQSAKQPRSELLLDLKTYRVLGMRTRIGTEPIKQLGPFGKPGSLIDYTALVDVGISDELGDWR